VSSFLSESRGYDAFRGFFIRKVASVAAAAILPIARSCSRYGKIRCSWCGLLVRSRGWIGARLIFAISREPHQGASRNCA
jgi:hypothetical protein